MTGACTLVYMISKYAYVPTGIEGGGGAEGAQVQSDEFVFYEWYHVGVSQPWRSSWHPGSRRLVVMVYVGLWFPENMPTHAPHFRGV